MTDKFKKIPIDKDTKILYEKIIELEGIDTMYQKWSWDGLIGESIIFHINDIENISDEYLVNILSHSGLLKSSIENVTVQQPDLSEYLFVNFNFEY